MTAGTNAIQAPTANPTNREHSSRHRKDWAQYGAYPTKELILAEYDRMTAVRLTLVTPPVESENYTSPAHPTPEPRAPPPRKPIHSLSK
ncbi:hypothetical protein [Streptomyces sp. NPDC007264]|uniref:hypothetical protein n=1 Tax=Streptomyces sp. NPDC007264 TaxID=3364777 RepID=UPI0036D8FF5A